MPDWEDFIGDDLGLDYLTTLASNTRADDPSPLICQHRLNCTGEFWHWHSGADS